MEIRARVLSAVWFGGVLGFVGGLIAANPIPPVWIGVMTGVFCAASVGVGYAVEQHIRMVKAAEEEKAD